LSLNKNWYSIAGTKVSVGKLSTGAVAPLDLSTGYHQIRLTGGTGINMVTNYLRGEF
jgi:hypothetical protein